MFEPDVGLMRVCKLEIIRDRQGERQDRAKPGESLIVEALPPELVIRIRSDARREYPWLRSAHWGRRRVTTRANGALKNLRCIQQLETPRITRHRHQLLLLGCVGNVGVESDRQQRMVIEQSIRRAED